jgi:hypothetical protein
MDLLSSVRSCERSVAALAAEIAGEASRRAGFGELAGEKHLPVIVGGRSGGNGAVEVGQEPASAELGGGADWTSTEERAVTLT